MEISATGYGDILVSTMAQGTISMEELLAENANVALLDQVLDLQEDMAAQLLQSLGVGQHIAIRV